MFALTFSTTCTLFDVPPCPPMSPAPHDGIEAEVPVEPLVCWIIMNMDAMSLSSSGRDGICNTSTTSLQPWQEISPLSYSIFSIPAGVGSIVFGQSEQRWPSLRRRPIGEASEASDLSFNSDWPNVSLVPPPYAPVGGISSRSLIAASLRCSSVSFSSVRIKAEAGTLGRVVGGVNSIAKAGRCFIDTSSRDLNPRAKGYSPWV